MRAKNLKNNSSPEFNFYIGLDVHKKSWSVTIRTLGLEVAHFTQKPNPSQLLGYLKKNFPEGQYFCAYEAGFSGTSLHFALNNLGIQNIVVNAADIPQTNKQKNSKTDLHDSRSIAKYLEKGLLSGIHVLSIEQQEIRALFRCREATVKDTSRAINRLRSFLYFFGIEVPDVFKDKTYISKKFTTWLSTVKLSTSEGNESLKEYINQLHYHRNQVLLVTKQLRKSILERFDESFTCMLSVPGIGPVTAMGILSETGDLNRFKNPDEYASYLGLIPAEHRSGEFTNMPTLQPRCNMHLRPLLVESAWFAIKQCPTILAYYKKHAGKNSKKAIIKVARKIALIAKSVSINKTPYDSYYGILSNEKLCSN